ncbi:MAG: sporulation transcriptional regulator SpoIIID [Oscillospiraceae bacterium]|nr:sporulation transcriptional regulator SpoIIID [Oscillospiraceae bacterium]
MKDKHFLEDRSVELAEYLVSQKATVRSTAQKFGVSKSTVHKDITERLKKVNPQLYKQVAEILKINKEERHIRGGLATKKKYEETHEKEDSV